MENLDFSSLGDAQGSGQFTPITFLTYFAFPEDALLETRSVEGIRVNRTLWHEYQHFLQFTSTTFGLNLFLWEFDRALFTWEYLTKLLDVVPTLEFPLLAWRNRTSNRQVKALIDEGYEALFKREETIGVLMGDCEPDLAANAIIYRGQRVASPNKICPFIKPDVTSRTAIGLGARAIMEGAASLIELEYLGRRKLFDHLSGSSSQHVDDALAAWENLREADPRYYSVIDLGAKAGIPSHINLILCDLALFTPVETEVIAPPLERSPGFRYLQCLEAAKSMAFPKDFLRFHSWYREYVESLCRKLGWKTPWQMVTNRVLDFVTDETPQKPLQLLGLGAVMLRGLSIRQSSPSYCAYPFQDFPPLTPKDTSGQGPAGILYLNMMQAVHPFPFVNTSGQRSFMFSELAERSPEAFIKKDWKFKAIKLANQLRGRKFSEAEYVRLLKTSFEEYYIGQRLVNLIWHGSAGKRRNACLRLDGESAPSCQGGVEAGDFTDIDACACKSVLKSFLPCPLRSIRWVYN